MGVKQNKIRSGNNKRIISDTELFTYPEYIFWACKALQEIKGAEYDVVTFNEIKMRPVGNIVVRYRGEIITLNFMYLKKQFPWTFENADIYKLIIREELKKILRNWNKIKNK